MSDDETELRRLNEMLLGNLLERDIDSLETLLAPDFSAIHITGARQSRADWLEQISSGRMSYHHVVEESIEIDVDGNTATVTTRSRVDATIWGAQSIWPLESTTTYARTNNTWVIARSRATTY